MEVAVSSSPEGVVTIRWRSGDRWCATPGSRRSVVGPSPVVVRLLHPRGGLRLSCANHSQEAFRTGSQKAQLLPERAARRGPRDDATQCQRTLDRPLDVDQAGCFCLQAQKARIEWRRITEDCYRIVISDHVNPAIEILPLAFEPADSVLCDRQSDVGPVAPPSPIAACMALAVAIARCEQHRA